MEPPYFSVHHRPMVSWGDYGHILQHGMGLMLPRRDGLMVLLRTGPYLPEITFPGWPSFDSHGSGIVVVDSLRTALERSGLTGLGFQPVLKGRIVHLPWHEWDLNSDRPHLRPPGGEPANYILEDAHSAETSDALGDLWELVPRSIDWLERYVERNQDGQPIVRFRFVQSRCDNTDFFCVKPTATLLCSAQAKKWAESRLSEWVSFSALLTV